MCVARAVQLVRVTTTYGYVPDGDVGGPNDRFCAKPLSPLVKKN
jgi:hypothetical protein